MTITEGQWAHAPNGIVESVSIRPKWFVGEEQETAQIAPDNILMEGNWFPVIDDPPAIDPVAQVLTRLPFQEWQVEPDHVGVTYAVVDRSAADIQNLRSQGVIAERERRLALGFDYDFGDDRGVHRIGTTKADMAGWDEVTKLAAAYIAKGAGSATILISTDTGPVLVTALEWQDILVAAGDVRQPIYQASFALMAMDPIPADYADDERWA